MPFEQKFQFSTIKSSPAKKKCNHYKQQACKGFMF